MKKRVTKEERRAYMQAYTARYHKTPEQAPRQKARLVLGGKIKSGKVVRGPCVVCGAEKTHGHHTDYSKPLDVTWLCKEHHDDVHYPNRKYQAKQVYDEALTMFKKQGYGSVASLRKIMKLSYNVSVQLVGLMVEKGDLIRIVDRPRMTRPYRLVETTAKDT